MKLRPILIVYFLFLAIHGTYAQKQQTGIDSMLIVLAKAGADTNKVKLLHQLTLATEGVDPKQALGYTRQAYALSQKLNWKKGMLNALRYMGSYHMEMGENEEALRDYTALYSLSKALKEKRDMISSLNGIGAVYERTSKYATAADYLFRALKIAEQDRNIELIAKCESNIAVLFIQQRDFEKARYYAIKADKQYQHLGLPSYEAKNLEVLGNCYAFDGKYEAAKPYYLKALKLYGQTGDEMGKATILTQLVDCYTNDPLSQINYLQKAKSIWDKLAPNNLNAIANIGNFGFVYFGILKDPDKLKLVQDRLGLDKVQMLADAESYLKRSIMLSQEAGIVDLVSQLTIVYSALCEYKKDYKGALDNLKIHIRLQDSISSQEIKNKIARLEGEREIALRDKQIQLSKLEIRQFWLYGVIAFIVVTGLSTILLNRSRISHLRLKNQLQKKESEEQNKELLYRNKLSESELKAIRSQMNPHFIFNVLNSIESYIVEEDSKTASRLVQKFASLSRLILENSIQSLVTADREWKALQLYTELEAMRFNHQFSYSFYADPSIDLSLLMLPPMLVQPLIENSVHHGMRNSNAENNRINISLEQTETEIYFTVEDNGIGIDEAEKYKTYSAVKNKSIGLSAIRERIEILNVMNEEKSAVFEIRNKHSDEGSGTVAILTLPKIFKD